MCPFRSYSSSSPRFATIQEILTPKSTLCPGNTHPQVHPPRRKHIFPARSTCLRIRVYTNVDSDVCKCRCQMSTGFPANVDGNVENISIYHGKKAQKTKIKCWQNAEKYVDIYTYIYIYIHTHTHAHNHAKTIFFCIFTRKSAIKLGTDSKKCQCRLKRPANVEHMSMSMVPPNINISVYTLTCAALRPAIRRSLLWSRVDWLMLLLLLREK